MRGEWEAGIGRSIIVLRRRVFEIVKVLPRLLLAGGVQRGVQGGGEPAGRQADLWHRPFYYDAHVKGLSPSPSCRWGSAQRARGR